MSCGRVLMVMLIVFPLWAQEPALIKLTDAEQVAGLKLLMQNTAIQARLEAIVREHRNLSERLETSTKTLAQLAADTAKVHQCDGCVVNWTEGTIESKKEAIKQ